MTLGGRWRAAIRYVQACRPLEVSSLGCSDMLGMEPELDLCKLRHGATKPAVVVWHRGGDVVTEALTAAVEAP
jgi:hypothetical protein